MLSLAWLVLLLVGSKAFRRPVAYVSTLHGKLARVGVAVSPNLDMGVDEGMRQESHSISTVDCVEGFFKQFNDMPHASTPEAVAAQELRDQGVLTLQKIKDGKIGLPTGKAEAWRHSNLRTIFPCEKYGVRGNSELDRELIAERINEYVDENCEGSCIVYVDGRFDGALSRLDHLPDQVNIDTFGTGSVSGSGGVTRLPVVRACMTAVPDANELGRDSFSSDSLTAVNMANCIDACLIHVAKGKRAGGPLHIINYSTDGTTGDSDEDSDNSSNRGDGGAGKTMPTSFPKVVVVLEEGSHLSFKQSFIGRESTVGKSVKAGDLKNAALVLSNTHIHVSEGATLEHSYEQDLPAEHRHLEVVHADLYTGAAYDLCVLQSGAKTGRVNAHINLHETNSSCSLNSVNLSHQRQHHDLHSSIVHSAPECESRQQHRNVLGYRGETVFKGRIRIPKIAQKTESEQLCRTLILGEKSRLVAMPTLEITADDVVCSHGAAVADLDENSMFYLSARGIDRREARKLLLRGFSLEVLEGGIMDKKAMERVIAKTDAMTPEVDQRVQGSNQRMISM